MKVIIIYSRRGNISNSSDMFRVMRGNILQKHAMPFKTYTTLNVGKILYIPMLVAFVHCLLHSPYCKENIYETLQSDSSHFLSGVKQHIY